MRGKFITFEGGEGAGKSTQVKLFVERLVNFDGKKVIVTREPGGSPGGELIRKLLVEGEPTRWLPMSEALLFLAARFDHVERVIKPALERGEWVVSDRFLDSSYVYQGVARGLGLRVVDILHQIVLNEFEPDLTFILDIEPTLGLSRAAKRKGDVETRFHEFDLQFHEKLNQAYLKRAALRRCELINASREQTLVTNDIWERFTDRQARSLL